MSVKISLTLDNNANYDLLVRTLQLRCDELKVQADQHADRGFAGQRQQLLKEVGALELLIRQVT